MTDFFLRFNIHDDCDFGLKEFSAIYRNIYNNGLNDINTLNNELKKDVKTHNIQISNIEYINDNVIINCNIDPI